MLLSALVLGEHPAVTQLIGCVLILAGAQVATLRRPQHSRSPEPAHR